MVQQFIQVILLLQLLHLQQLQIQNFLYKVQMRVLLISLKVYQDLTIIWNDTKSSTTQNKFLTSRYILMVMEII